MHLPLTTRARIPAGSAITRFVLCALVFLGLLCPCISALAPSLDVSQYEHKAWTIREGFTGGQITAIAQTPDGYLWLATGFGLLRFDGVHVIPWSPPAGQQLPGNFISDLLVSRDGTLWIATWKGLASWKNGQLTQYPETFGQIVTSPVQDGEGTVWVGVYGPGRLCAIREGKMQCYGAGRFGRSVSALYADPKGNLWVSAQSGLWRWAPGTPEHYAFPGGAVEATALIEGEHGELVMATAIPGAGPATTTGSIEGLKELRDGKIQNYDAPGFAGHFRPKCLFRSSDGSLWIGTVEGLLHFHGGKTDRFALVDGLSGDVVTSIFEDREGSIWVSTDGGLNRFREFAIPTISAKQGLSSSSVHLVEATPDGSMWISTADGLNRWENGHVTVYGRRETGVRSGSAFKEIANSGLPSTPRSLGQDRQGRLLAATREGVYLFERGRFSKIPGVPGGDIFSLVGDGQGNVWISNNDLGLVHSTPQGAVQEIPWAHFGHKEAAIKLLLDQQHGGLWLGFFDGGIAYFKDSQVPVSYNTADGLGKGLVGDLQPASGGGVWAATEGGLSRIKDGRVSTLTTKNGLPCDQIFWAMEDDEHAVWLSTGCGVVRIAGSELGAWMKDAQRSVRTTVFDALDGVRSRSGRYHPKVAKALDGKLWFVALDGASVIDPRYLPFNKIAPPVHIEQITADGKKYDVVQGLALPARVRDLSIDYTALSLAAPDKVRFRFKLEGQDNDWREVINERRVEYSNLGPGKYTFRVTACNNSGVWNEEDAFLAFSIVPAYWQTNWFRALGAAAFVILLWAAYQLRVRALHQRQALLERHEGEISALNERLIKVQEEERMRIAGELHDGILQQLTSLSLQLGTAMLELPIDSQPKAEVRDVEKKLIEVGAEIRQLSHELHPATLKETGLPLALHAYCEEFSKLRSIPISYQADKDVEELSPGAALCIYRIAQEALGNVAKHANATRIEVRLSRLDGRVRLSVVDDGVGFDLNSAEKSAGLGLINMRERVRQMDGAFAFDSEPGRGTMVTAEVPFKSRS